MEAILGAQDRLALGILLARVLGQPDLDLEGIPATVTEVGMSLDRVGAVGEDKPD